MTLSDEQPGEDPLLVVDDLRTSFSTPAGEARAVDGVSFEVRKGETLGVVGESGCGKTVTALSVLGLVDRPGRILEGSSVRFRGEELVGARARRLREIRGGDVAMIFQEPMTSLNPVYTVGDQILETLRLHVGLKGAEGRQRAVELLGEVGIPDPDRRVDAHPHELSGGMRQRVMIAMALAGDPDLLIADEPTTALDVTIQAQILAILDRLRRERGMAMILITHDLAVVAEVCDRVAVMYAGQVVEEGSVDRIFRDPVHPYTRGLLASLPRLGSRIRRLRPIPGQVPPATDWPAGCRFRDRCPHAWSRCLEHPPLLEPGARCWLVEEPHRREGGFGEGRGAGAAVADGAEGGSGTGVGDGGQGPEVEEAGPGDAP
ncbi:MAG: ABC transporter ATP-binding protein [Longimicrobiales bacterium]|nr:ABC transporter ATP-binding protein [Longimicrobiales bacterium]